MPIDWRWDQGRLMYYNFESLRLIAQTLVDLQGIPLRSSGGDLLRAPLMTSTGLPFLPVDDQYPVWRNYARVFGTAFLAADIDNSLQVTDACRGVAGSPAAPGWTADEYLSFLIPRFYCPSPVFVGYSATTERVFPFCAVLKFLIARYRTTGFASTTLAELFSKVIGNDRTGLEPTESYATLPDTGYQPMGDKRRQAREALIVLSQSSWLKWLNDTLVLDIPANSPQAAQQIEDVATPLPRPRLADRAAEVLTLGATAGFAMPLELGTPRDLPSDTVFTEGRRVRVNHLRIERSPQLRTAFLRTLRPPVLCDMCRADTNWKYPWVPQNLLVEVHHLLPLASALSIGQTGTSLNGLVQLCPTCHRGVHAFYSGWLTTQAQEDFLSPQDARTAYDHARAALVS